MGKARRVDTQSLWVRDVVREGRFVLNEFGGKPRPRAANAKHVDRVILMRRMAYVVCEWFCFSVRMCSCVCAVCVVVAGCNGGVCAGVGVAGAGVVVVCVVGIGAVDVAVAVAAAATVAGSADVAGAHVVAVVGGSDVVDGVGGGAAEYAGRV